MMGNTVIEVNNISKRYRIGLKEEVDTFAEQVKNTLLYPIRNFKKITSLNTFKGEDDQSIFWALQNINFKVEQGEVLGIIGKNGAGKSTLLKILSKITEPTTGNIKLKGRVSALLEVGTGFHPELTGRDNIYMNGTILGMTRKEINQKLDEIIAFSGIEKHIDTPVKFYSSGMKVRLGFSVAAHLEPEILIIDEVLAVGDFEFQKKCLGKMDDVAKSGRTVLFVSHDMAAVEKLCSRVMVLSKGSIIENTTPTLAIDSYLVSSEKIYLSNEKLEVKENGEHFVINRLEVLPSGGALREIKTGENFFIELDYKNLSLNQLESIDIAFHIFDKNGKRLSIVTPSYYQKTINNLGNSGRIRCTITKNPFSNGKYSISMWLNINHSTEKYFDNIIELSVEKGDFYGTGKVPKASHNILINLEHSWESKS